MVLCSEKVISSAPAETSMDLAADKASPQTRDEMHRAYTHAAQLEWMSCDSA